MTVESASLDHILALVRKLTLADQARLVARITPELARALEATAPESPQLGHSSARALLAHAGAWAGNDIEARLAEVYATRQPVRA
jgi:hypothetical protein